MAELTAEQPSRDNLMRRILRLQNPFMQWLLRSPLQGIVSQWYMLMTITGRKSGRQFTTPVQYAREGDTLYVITSRANKWWRNLRGCPEVTLRLRGQTVRGRAHVETEADAVERAVRVVYPRLNNRQFTRFLPAWVAVLVELGGDA